MLESSPPKRTVTRRTGSKATANPTLKTGPPVDRSDQAAPSHSQHSIPAPYLGLNKSETFLAESKVMALPPGGPATSRGVQMAPSHSQVDPLNQTATPRLGS